MTPAVGEYTGPRLALMRTDRVKQVALAAARDEARTAKAHADALQV